MAGEMSMEIPVISMWQPWAQWVSLGWKTIETRTHQRFRSLVGQRIGIHCALKWDDNALVVAAPYLTDAQKAATARFLRIGGAVICTVKVTNHWRLYPEDAAGALIECDTLRYGLFLTDVQVIPAIPMRGHQGIWRTRIEESA